MGYTFTELTTEILLHHPPPRMIPGIAPFASPQSGNPAGILVDKEAPSLRDSLSVVLVERRLRGWGGGVLLRECDRIAAKSSAGGGNSADCASPLIFPEVFRYSSFGINGG